MQLIPIAQTAEQNTQFFQDSECREILHMSIDYYSKIGFLPPWICYFALENRKIVGSAGFKGRPRNGTVEIAYGTFEGYRRQGMGTLICRELVKTARAEDPSVRITARTLPDNESSIGILKKCGFRFVKMVNDEEDGEVCEWEYINLPD